MVSTYKEQSLHIENLETHRIGSLNGLRLCRQNILFSSPKSDVIRVVPVPLAKKI